jgi:hypothetical protein
LHLNLFLLAHKLEFRDYCSAIFTREPEDCRFTVSESKVFGFLFYQAFREKRKRGPNKKHHFDEEDYTRVMNQYGAEQETMLYLSYEHDEDGSKYTHRFTNDLVTLKLH